MVSLDDTGYYYTRHWNISSTMFVMLLRFVLCVLLQFRKNTQLATVGTHHHLCPESFDDNNITKIVWAMSYMKSRRAGCWATHKFEHEVKSGHLRFIDWPDFEDEF